jgi:GntR family transcriptional regulator
VREDDRVVTSGTRAPTDHRVVVDQLRALIDEGEWEVDERLPAERVLADRLGVSRMTLRRAVQHLESAGALRRVPGSRGGVYVAPRVSSVDITSLVGLRTQLLRSVQSATSRVVSARTQPAPADVAAALELGPGDPVHEVVRVRFANEVPVVLERSSFPAHRFPGLLERELTGSMYELMADAYGLAPTLASQQVEPVALDGVDADLLDTARGTLALAITRVSLASRGIAVEHSRDVFRTDQLRVVVAGRVTP